jgi:hypothetical protein
MSDLTLPASSSEILSILPVSPVKITDEFDGLSVSHFSDCDYTSPSEIKDMRGIIKDEDIVVCKSFAFTPELREDHPDLPGLLEPFLTRQSKVFQSLEGTLLRVWFREVSSHPNGGEWFLSTHRKLDAFFSRWGSDNTYGEHFVCTLLRAAKIHPALQDISTFEGYANLLKKHKVYVLLLRTSKENRVVCNTEPYTTLYTVGAFDRQRNFAFEYPSEVPEAVFPSIPEINITPWSVEGVRSTVQSVQPFEYQGVIFIDDAGNTLKVLNNSYEEMVQLRGNVPNVLLRYIQLRNGSDAEQAVRYQELYKDFSNDFVTFERVIREISHNIHKKYIIRFVHHKLAVVPPEQYQLIRELHQQYIENKKKIVTLDVILNYIKTLTAGKLMYLYTKFLQREAELGSGNYVTDEERQMTFSKKVVSV